MQKRKILVRAFLQFLILAMVIGCKGKPTGEKTIAVIPMSTRNIFWTNIKAGAEEAGKNFGVKVIWKGAAEETDIAGQISIIEDFINKRVDALVIAACDTKALVPTIKKATNVEIPVITIDSAVDSDLPLCFVATDNILGGRKAGQILASLIGEKGKVGLIAVIPGAASTIERKKGFRDEISKYPNISLVSVLYSYADAARGMAATEDMLTAHPDLSGIFCCAAPGGTGCSQALGSLGLAGKVKLVAFDSDPAEIAGLKKGTIQALVVQNPYKMGYLGVKTAVEAIQKKSVPKRIDTGITVVTMENFNQPEIQKLLYPVKPLSK